MLRLYRHITDKDLMAAFMLTYQVVP